MTWGWIEGDSINAKQPLRKRVRKCDERPASLFDSARYNAYN